MSTISVIVPVYKVEKYLRRCIDSILAQTFTDFNLLLIDDGSPDACGAICDYYAKKDARITVIHQKNSGVSVARNRGIEWALNHPDQQWLTFIDSDDWIHPLYLESLLNAANHFHTKISQVGVLETPTDLPFPTYDHIEKSLLAAGDAYRIYGVCPWGKLFHTSLLKDIRFPVGKRHEDEFTTYRIIFSQSHIAYVDNDMYFYCLRDDSFMHAPWNPQRLHCLDARDEQLSFFSQKNLPNEYTFIYHYYLKDLETSFRHIKSSNLPDRTKYLKQIRKRTRNILRNHGPAPKPTIQSRPAIFEIAYPRYMYLYWTLKGILRKSKP